MPLKDPEKLKDVSEEGIADVEKAIRDASAGKSSDASLVAEWHERVENSAQVILRRRREELERRRPWWDEIRSYPPKERDLTNALARLLEDAELVRSGSFPSERIDELLDWALNPYSRVDLRQEAKGMRVYSWAVLDALYRCETIPVDHIRARLDTQFPRKATILPLLRAKGESVDEVDMAAALEEARSGDVWPDMQGYCRLLAARANEDPKAVLSLVPEPHGEAPGYVEAMIAETLSNATGQPFGLDLNRWREWLACRD